MENQEEGFNIIKLKLLQWQDYKNIRLVALKSDPQAFLSSYEREAGWLDEKWMSRLQETFEPGSWLLFAKTSSGELIGMIGGYRDSNDLVSHTAQIWGVYVKQEHRGNGVAKALMKAILEEFNLVDDIDTAVLEVNTDQKSAKKLYEAFGFGVSKTYRQKLGDGLEHEISEMRKSLKKE